MAMIIMTLLCVYQRDSIPKYTTVYYSILWYTVVYVSKISPLYLLQRNNKNKCNLGYRLGTANCEYRGKTYQNTKMFMRRIVSAIGILALRHIPVYIASTEIDMCSDACDFATLIDTVDCLEVCS